MVRELKKPAKGIEALKELEAVTDKEVKEIAELKAKDFKDDELDTGCYFSVVFDTKAERDNWLKEHGVKLVEDFFVKAKDFNI